ncbi:lipopolysaccharide heptosyltransferase II [Gammaproteobacteria bacterium]|nr:lipopolysaccharide heptosyltransferase II [Gammaproteobacteria bacterium]MDB2443723.1 lipopolysaccharide heptosyltransferase II [Gammaproteobacteria bacterium]
MEADLKAQNDDVLIVGPSWIGDMVMAQVLFILIKTRYPNGKITVLAPDWARSVLNRMSQIDAVISLPFIHGDLRLRARRELGESLRQNNYDRAIVLPNSYKSALVPFFAKIENRIGWRGEMRYLLLTDCRWLDKRKFPKMIDRFAALAFPNNAELPKELPSPKLVVTQSMVLAAFEKFELRKRGPVLAICPGAEFGVSKQWPANHFIGLCNSAIADGWYVWMFGSVSDMPIANAIYEGIEREYKEKCENFTGRTTLEDAIDLMGASSAVVSNDSGLMHVAAALEKPLIALYGSSSPDFTPPLSDASTILKTDIECRPCFKRVCPLGHGKCLSELLPAVAYSAVQNLDIL